MPSRYNSYHSERKISQGKASKPAKAGSSGSVKEKTANWPGLPGKASHWYKVSGPKVKIYPSSKGLC